jgi:nucleoside-diphosphate-sugar epimerase
MSTRSLVTGANGFVGRHLVAALAARGDQVTAVDLEPAPAPAGVRSVGCDIRDKAQVMALVAGHDVVFHNASVVHTRSTNAETVWAVNLGGTENIIEACQAAGVTRLVYVSSASCVYEGRDIENGDESLPYSTISQAHYADSKIAAEKLVLAKDGEGGLRTTSIRPHVIFGPGDQRFLPAVLTRARAGKLKFGVGWATKLSDFTYVDNLVDALLLADEALATDKAGVGGESFFVTNGEPRPFFDFVGQVLARLELPAIKGKVPYPVAYSVAAISETWNRMMGREKLGEEDGISRFAVRYMCTHHYFSIDRARDRLGYVPKVSLDEGIERTCQAILAEAG